MDPQTIKLIQRLLLEIAGIGLLIWGLIFIFRGIAGKITFIMKGGGLGVKLANASPGVFLVFLGAVLMWLSIKDFSVEKKTTTEEIDTGKVLDQWLSNAGKVNGKENYIQTIDIVIGKEETSRFKTKYITIHPP
jgi:uncharacterized protein (DUF58 family)